MFSFYRQFSLLLVAFRRLKFLIHEMQILLHLFLDCILFRPSRLKAHIFFLWYQTILSDMAALTSRRQLRDSPKYTNYHATALILVDLPHQWQNVSVFHFLRGMSIGQPKIALKFYFRKLYLLSFLGWLVVLQIFSVAIFCSLRQNYEYFPLYTLYAVIETSLIW